MNSSNGLNTPTILVHALGGVGLLAMTLGGYLFVIEPVLQGRAERESLEMRLRSDSDRLESLREARDGLRARVSSGEQRLAESGDSLLGMSGRNKRMGELTELAGECGLRLDRLQPGDPAREEMFTVTPITMQGVGSYDNVSVFLHRIIERFSDVSARSFSLEAQGEESDRQAAFVFELAWYADPADQSGG